MSRYVLDWAVRIWLKKTCSAIKQITNTVSIKPLEMLLSKYAVFCNIKLHFKYVDATELRLPVLRFQNRTVSESRTQKRHYFGKATLNIKVMERGMCSC